MKVDALDQGPRKGRSKGKGKDNHVDKEREKASSPKGKGRGNKVCWHCGKPGHRQADCRRCQGCSGRVPPVQDSGTTLDIRIVVAPWPVDAIDKGKNEGKATSKGKDKDKRCGRWSDYTRVPPSTCS